MRLSQDSPNPYQPPQSSLLVERQQVASQAPQKARPLSRFFAGIIGILMVISGFGRFSVHIADIGYAIAMFAFGVQFIVAGVTGYWYSWFGRRL